MISPPPGDKTLVTVYVEALQQPVVLGDDIRQPYHPTVRGPTVRCDAEGCLLYPRKRTCAVQLGMSAKGQKRTHAVQQRGSLFDHFVGHCLRRLPRIVDFRQHFSISTNYLQVYWTFIAASTSRTKVHACL